MPRSLSQCYTMFQQEKTYLLVCDLAFLRTIEMIRVQDWCKLYHASGLFPLHYQENLCVNFSIFQIACETKRRRFASASTYLNTPIIPQTRPCFITTFANVLDALRQIPASHNWPDRRLVIVIFLRQLLCFQTHFSNWRPLRVAGSVGSVSDYVQRYNGHSAIVLGDSCLAHT